MEIVIHRKWRREGYTIGRMYIDGKFFCHTLEDEDRGLAQYMNVGEIMTIKLAGKTAIPAGDYKVCRTYSPRFKKMMAQIMNVKGFSGVRIHAGNKSTDTDGCPLLGDADENSIQDWISNSRKRYIEFDTRLQVAGGNADLHIVYEYGKE